MNPYLETLTDAALWRLIRNARKRGANTALWAAWNCRIARDIARDTAELTEMNTTLLALELE